MSETTYTQEPGKYHAQKTEGGWFVIFVEDGSHARNVDGGKVHKSRQNAWAKADQLNHPIKHALKKYGMAEAEFRGGDYTAVVQDKQDEFDHQYSLDLLANRQGAMPPFKTLFFDSLDELEQYVKQELPQPLYWQAVKPEEI